MNFTYIKKQCCRSSTAFFVLFCLLDGFQEALIVEQPVLIHQLGCLLQVFLGQGADDLLMIRHRLQAALLVGKKVIFSLCAS